MSKKFSKNHRKEQGQSLVEFSVGMIILVIILVGAVDAGRALLTYLSMRDAAQEGAIYGSTEPYIIAGGSKILNPSISSRAMDSSDMMSSLIGDIQVDVEFINRVSRETFTVADKDPCMGDGIRVKLTYENFPLSMPLVGSFIGAGDDYTIPISASVVDTVLRPPCP
jgi:hypothetical protein